MTLALTFVSPLPVRALRSRPRCHRFTPFAVTRTPSPPSRRTPAPPPETPRIPTFYSNLQTDIPPPTRTSPPPDTDPKPPPPDSPLWPRVLLLLVAAIFGTNFPTVKFLQSGADPIPASVAALARFSLAAVALTPIAIPQLRAAPLPPKLVPTAALVGIPVFLGYYAQALSLDGTDAGKSAFLCSLAVVIVPILTRLFPVFETKCSKEEQSPLSIWGAPLLAVGGVALLELGGLSPPNMGDAWGLIQAVAFALGFMLNERAAALFPGYSLSISAIQLSVVAAFSCLWAGADSSLTEHAFVLPSVAAAFSSAANGLGLLYAGLVSTALTVLLSNVALSRVTAGELTVLLSTEPLWAAVFSAFALDERMGSGTFMGAALILAACVLNQADTLPIGKVSKEPVSGLNPLVKAAAVLPCVQAFINRINPPST